jgi:hypothetical protein
MDTSAMTVTEICVSAAISATAPEQVVNLLREKRVNYRISTESARMRLLASMNAKRRAALFCQIRLE